MQVEIWSDIACPWCAVGKARFEAALADFEHRSMLEIAEASGLSVPAVKTRLHRARLSVRRDLELYLEGRT